MAQKKKQRMPNHEKLLRKFQYKDALDSVLKASNETDIYIATWFGGKRGRGICACFVVEKEREGREVKTGLGGRKREVKTGLGGRKRERKCNVFLLSQLTLPQVKWRGKNNQQRLVVYSLLQELARRDGLSRALSGRNEQELYPILLFTRFSILEPKYSSFMLDVFDLILGEMCGAPLGTCMRAHRHGDTHTHTHTHTLTLSHTQDIYGETLYQSKRISGLLRLVKMKIERELAFQRRSFQLLGAIDALLTVAMTTNRHTPSSAVDLTHNTDNAAASIT